MLRLDKVIKPWKEAAALNDHINLYGFWNETTFLTKSGDVGMVLGVPGVDYESLDRAAQEYAVKRLEAALKAFGPGFHVYQYLFKSNRPDIPFAHYDDPVVEAAIEQRRQFFEAKKDHLYQIEIFYAIVLEGSGFWPMKSPLDCNKPPRTQALVAPQGFEPRYAAPEAAVLPLNEGAMRYIRSRQIRPASLF